MAMPPRPLGGAPQVEPPGPPPQQGPGGQLVFKPRESLARFASFFPPLIAGTGLLFLAGCGVGYYLGGTSTILVPAMMLMPLGSVTVGMLYARRMMGARVIIDPQRLRLLQDNKLQMEIPWGAITRLQIQPTDQGDEHFLIWAGAQELPFPAAFFDHQDKLLAEISRRANRPWERPRKAATTRR